MDTAEPVSAGAKFVPLVLLLGSGQSVVLGEDSVDQNVDESSPYLAWTGITALTQLQEWLLVDMSLGIFQMPRSTQSCLGQ